MKLQSFFEHHGIARNPFSEEDAQSDQVFKDYCIHNAFHPSWDKIFGQPTDPATSVVFGEKGAGKTAMRLQITRHLQAHNREHAEARGFIIQYDDFNPFIDRFVNRLPSRRRRIDRALASWRLWDHMDAILSLGVTDLVNRVVGSSQLAQDEVLAPADCAKLDRHQSRDLLLLAACYDQSTEQAFVKRWDVLRRRLGFWNIKARLPLWFGAAGTALLSLIMLVIFLGARDQANFQKLWSDMPRGFYPLCLLLVWLPWLLKCAARTWMAWGIARSLRVLNRPIQPLRRALMGFRGSELAGQPIPNQDRTDDRYELLTKFQGILQSLGYGGVFVLVDRVDEPYLINGTAELMKALIWPMLDNKFLKHPGLGVKLLLPAELKYFVEREDRDFNQRARLDKQNMVPSLAWTGEALFDVANARLRACAMTGRTPSIGDFFDESISHQRLLEGFRNLRVPRHLHKFLYQLLVSHCNSHTDDHPQWRISKERFESDLALYERDMAENRL